MSIGGSCLCGKVKLTVTSFARDVVACHCTQCRKQTGHFVAATRVENSKLTISGKEHLKWYKASADATRGFCQHCGSVLFWRSKDSDSTSIMAGCLDSPTGLTVSHHIYATDKGDYYEIDDGKPLFEKSDQV